MNLEDNVAKIKDKIRNSFHKRLVRLGIRDDQINARDEEDPDFKKAKAAVEAILEDEESFEEAREEYLDEVTFTLFNRLAGIKTMEAESRQLVPEIIQIRAQHGDKSFAHNVWLEENQIQSSETLEGLDNFIRAKFNELSDELPLYSKENPYDLLPEVHDLKDIINLFNEEISLDDWKKDDILGWLYEAYNKKDYQDFKESGDKIEWDKLSLSSQMYTPRWVVEFLVNNSLGKYWLEINPDSKIRDNHNIANAPEKTIIEPKSVEKIKVIDPASGSGNFLLYSFELLAEIYEEEGYTAEEIPTLILKNNLFGLDIDERSVQIARLQLYIKAKTYNRNTEIEDINVVSSNFHLPEFDKVKDQFAIDLEFAANEKEFLEELWNELREAHKFGSLLTLDDKLERFMADKKAADDLGLFDSFKDVDNIETEVLEKLESVISNALDDNYSSNFIKYQSLDAVKFAEIMLGVKNKNNDYEVNKYDISVANPPYTDSSNYGAELKSYVNDHYKEPISFHKNLYSCFLKKNSNFINEQGKIAMIHPLTFMYIKTFEDMREFILDKFHINSLIEFGLGGVFEDSNINVDTAGYILEKNNKIEKTFFMNLQEYKGHSNKKNIFQTAFEDYVHGIENKHNYTLDQEKLKLIDGYPFIYWISDSFREKFKEEQLDEVARPCKGMFTGNNLKYLRFWWEVNQENISDEKNDNKRWVYYSKGGPYKKWYGNLWLLIDWENQGSKIINYEKSGLRNEDKFFDEGITYSNVGAKGSSFRYLPNNHIFDSGGPAIFSDNINHYYLLGLFNSKTTSFILNCLNPTVNSTTGDLKRLPISYNEGISNVIIKAVKNNIQKKKKQYRFNIVEKEFEENPFGYNWNENSLNIEQRLKEYINFKYNFDCKILINEALIDELIFDVYELTESDRKMVLEQEGLPVGLFTVMEEDKNNYVENNKSDLEEEVIEFVNDLPIENDRSRENLKDNIKKLYKKNNSLEDIAKELELNPISVVEMIKEFDFYPKKLAYQKTHEFILDLTREILMENDDGIVMLNEYAGEEPLDKMIENKLYDKDFSSGDIKRLESILGKNIKDYLLSSFFADELSTLNLFRFLPKTPFIWHLSSGDQHGFDVYTIIYRWNRDKILKIKSYYIDKRKAGINNRLSNLSADDSAAAEKEKDSLRKQLNEIKDFENKLDDLLTSGYDPELDDGVGKNIAPLQDLGLLADDVLTKSQLKKFLNADW
ncbi:Eco57I restriction-modification methylase [Halanaerobium congolense]|jgi:hypothetical protein|uniref:site-specific DNA-methyltransferase (adenine-specific) n=1 Tax=Halanaerobium congolense TaxID=54121 RepID=A0A318EH63_9FIRM|nr:BREX-1 system adenine-specific DNA-methyltransferase PglX [Halanaerobium congolense]PXV70129.1 Eco57I restriction-modification methylase [Halanaerobium congolense]